jgi:excisionase family DNA binding protein
MPRRYKRKTDNASIFINNMITQTNPTQKEPVPPLIKVREVAKLLSISRATVHALIDNGELAASKVGPDTRKERLHVRITRKSLCSFYEKRFGQPLNRALENPFDS